MTEGESILEQIADDILHLYRIIDKQQACSDVNLLFDDEGNVMLENLDIHVLGNCVAKDTDDRKYKCFKPVDISETKTFVEQNKAKATVYKTKCDLKIFKEWAV
jgi:hypothetical protein